MKTLKYIALGVILSSLIFSSFSINPGQGSLKQEEKLIFCETYTQQEVIAQLDPDDSFFKLIQMEETDPESSRIGRCHQDDLKDLRSYFLSKEFLAKVQEDLIIVEAAETKDQMKALYAIKKSASKDMFPSGQDLDEVSVSKENDEEN